MSIKILSEDTIKKIAAGEVIERPSSVVKELVENSIDANAKRIVVEISKGGKDLIKVIDDGDGIESEDLPNAFLRHSTSKLSSFDDLYNITSLGFRGEALSSIVSVSELIINSKTKEAKMGRKLQYENSNIINEQAIGMNHGTTIEVRNLFYNVPVRKKFMASDMAEASQITNLMYRLAIGNFKIGFKYIKDQRIVFDTTSTTTLEDTIQELFGKDISKHFLPISIQEDDFKIHGLISDNIYYRGNRSMQYIYVNNRYIEHKNLRNEMEERYKQIIPNGRFPSFQLFIDINPSKIDVNIHPNKEKIKFINEDEILKSIRYSITDNLLKGIRLPKIEKKEEKSEDILYKEPYRDLLNQYDSYMVRENSSADSLSSTMSTQIPDEVEETIEEIYISNENTEDNKINSEEDDKINSFDIDIFKPVQETINLKREENPQENLNIKKETVNIDHPLFIKGKEESEIKVDPDILSIKGCLFNTYILCEDPKYKRFILVDQHAAHERINYEYYINSYNSLEILTQELLVPIILELDEDTYHTFDEHKETFHKLGYHIEDFGPLTITCRAVPQLFDFVGDEMLLRSLLDSLKDNKNLVEEEILNRLIMMSCKKSVKAGDALDLKEQQELIHTLFKMKYPYTCPHGRPTIIVMTQRDIEKEFMRIK